jgi:hypothetical protein
MNALFCEIERDVLVKLKKLIMWWAVKPIKRIPAIPVQWYLMVIICYTLSILLCFVFIFNHDFFRSDAIHPVRVLSNQVDSKVDRQIVEENVPVHWSLLLVLISYSFRIYCVLCLWLILTFLKLDVIRHVTVLSNQVDSQIEKEHTGWFSALLLQVIICFLLEYTVSMINLNFLKTNSHPSCDSSVKPGWYSNRWR